MHSHSIVRLIGLRCVRVHTTSPHDDAAPTRIHRDGHPIIAAIGTALPVRRFTQREIASLVDIRTGFGERVFSTAGIDTRHLFVDDVPIGMALMDEDQGQLLERHRRGSLALGASAIGRCLTSLGLGPRAVDFLCVVSSTGTMLPGLSAMYVRHCGFRADCLRADIVGMGCHAALNGLNVVRSWACCHRGLALLVCCEINSAMHVRDDRPVTQIVNSLFGDGCAAALIAGASSRFVGPQVIAQASHLIDEAWRAISLHWSKSHTKFELYLDRAIPDLLATHSPTPIAAVLRQAGVCRSEIKHWLIHAGGKKVIDAIATANALAEHDVRHSRTVLARYGNLGSPTVLFSYDLLLREGTVRPGDYGIMVTMGPGATVESALLRW